MKKLISFLSILIILFIVFLYIYHRPRNYELKYQVNNYQVVEQYNVKNAAYLYQIKDKNKVYLYGNKEAYSTKRHHITSIKTLSNQCIKIKLDQKNYPLCEDQAYSTINYEVPLSGNKQEIIVKADKHTNLAIWNYRGISFYNAKEKTETNYFLKDVYDNSLVTLVDHILFIPNYNQAYVFKEIYLFDLKTGESDTWEIPYEIAYDSEILGVYNNFLFLVDKKNTVLYELNLKKQKITIVGDENNPSKIMKNKWVTISTKKIANNPSEYKFAIPSIFYYYKADNTLYLQYVKYKKPIKIISHENIMINKVDGDKVYYTIDGLYYCYSPSLGNHLLVKYFEVNFNKDIVYVYNF